MENNSNNIKNMPAHIYFGRIKKDERLFAEYIYNLFQQNGRFNNISKELREYIIKKLNSKEIKKEDFLEKMSMEDCNYLLEKFIEEKLKNKKKFDSFIIPTVIGEDNFKNRSPLGIKSESEQNSYNLLEKIFRYGFPLSVGGSLYIFYIDPELVGDDNLFEFHQKFYQDKDLGSSQSKRTLSYTLNVSIDESSNISQNIYFLQDRDYFNSLLFIIALKEILNEVEASVGKDFIENIENADIYVWKRNVFKTGSEISGSIFVLSNIKFILDLIGNSVKSSELTKLLGYTFIIRNLLDKDKKNKDKIEKSLDSFSYYLLVKNMLDYEFIDELVRYSIDYKDNPLIKFLNKKFIIDSMEKVTDYDLSIFFELGQKLRKIIYSISARSEGSEGTASEDNKEISEDSNEISAGKKNNNKILEDFDKYIDRLAKDLRNESLPEYFLEAFEKDIVWLKSQGADISSDLSELLKKLVEEINRSDLPRFYMIKAAIILGLLSAPKAEKVNQMSVANNDGTK